MAADGHAPAFDVPTEALTRRVGQRRSITLNAGRASRREIHALQAQGYAEEIATYDRPQTRGDCLPGGCNGARPCPWVSCKAHLAIDVDDHTGSLKLNFPNVEVWEMAATCAYDLADEGGHTLEDVGAALSITRERTRQLEVRGLAKKAQSSTLIEYLDAPPTIHRAPPVEPKRPVGRRARWCAGLPVAPEHTPRAKTTPGHMLARLALARGASIDETMRLSGLTHASVQQLVWRVARAARRGAL